MEDRFNIHVYIYDDLEQLRRAVETIPSGIWTHVFDGRYYDFPGETDLTPGAEEFCGDHENLIYHAPDPDRLPFGDEDVPSRFRSSQNEKAEWANYEVLPGDEWSLQIDTDERIRRINREAFEEFDDENRYRPVIPIDDGREVSWPRIWKPDYWTLWIDDCAIPREYADRDTPIEDLPDKWKASRYEKIVEVPKRDIYIENEGMTRPDDYLLRRVEHLRAMGRNGRAEQLLDTLDLDEDDEGEGDRTLNPG